MTTKLWHLWINLRSSFWFVLALLILAAVVLAFTMVGLDADVGWHLAKDFPRVFGASAEGSRSILSGIASSMISIAGVTFSITIVALSLTSAQYTSRVLRNFMRDRANQMVLGVFLSIFVYCLIVLRTIRGGEESFVPSLSVVTGIVLGIIGIAFLIFFIHHVSTSIQASTIISNIGRETVMIIEALYPEKHADEDESEDELERFRRENFWTDVPASTTGYVQTVNRNALMEWGEQHQTMIQTRRGIGEFVVANEPLLAIAGRELPSAKDVAKLKDHLSIASFRTIEQDAGFGIRQLVDIALKALSPGVNDTTTAVTCLNYLGAILAKLARRKIPGAVGHLNGDVRLIARIQTFEFLVGETLHQIRQIAGSNVAVYHSLLTAIEAAHHPALAPARRNLLLQHAAHVMKNAETGVKDDADRNTIRHRHEQVIKKFG